MALRSLTIGKVFHVRSFQCVIQLTLLIEVCLRNQAITDIQFIS